MPKIIFVPTSHVAAESLENVRKTIEKEAPDCVAVELDELRYHSLETQQKEGTTGVIKFLGLPTFMIYWVLKKFQNYFGKKTGILPGSEMMEAVKIARERNIAVALIDQPIEITFFGMSKIPLSEKLRLLWLIAIGIFGTVFPAGKKEKFDLNHIPPEEMIEQAMEYLAKEFPGFYRVLVSDRNTVMANNLNGLGKRFEKIVCVIGAGHETGMKKLLGTVAQYKY